jgi:hypothetical protein
MASDEEMQYGTGEEPKRSGAATATMFRQQRNQTARPKKRRKRSIHIGVVILNKH